MKLSDSKTVPGFENCLKVGPINLDHKNNCSLATSNVEICLEIARTLTLYKVALIIYHFMPAGFEVAVSYILMTDRQTYRVTCLVATATKNDYIK